VANKVLPLDATEIVKRSSAAKGFESRHASDLWSAGSPILGECADEVMLPSTCASRQISKGAPGGDAPHIVGADVSDILFQNRVQSCPAPKIPLLWPRRVAPR
jgi:hypothetical protein